MPRAALRLEGWGPCHNLYAAVLVNALNAFRGDGGHARFREGAFLWFAGIGDAPLTFDAVCEALRLDPSAVRRALLGPAPILLLLKSRRKRGGRLDGIRTHRHPQTTRTRGVRHPYRLGGARYIA